MSTNQNINYLSGESVGGDSMGGGRRGGYRVKGIICLGEGRGI